MAATTYRVIAYNTAKDSDNKIHDDAVARRYGFGSGLVPGVDVYAYMTHPPVSTWGLAWLTHGTAGCRFQTPVYDGNEAVVTAAQDPDDSNRLTLSVDSAGESCATGWAALDADRIPPPSIHEIERAPLPDQRPPASTESLAAGRTLGTYESVYAAATAPTYLAEVREVLPVYAEEGIAHPGYILRLGNRALTENVVLGPWIHVGSTVQHFGLAHLGDRLFTRARVLDNYERKGHRFVELDVIVAVDDVRVIARIHHTAIYEPRPRTD